MPLTVRPLTPATWPDLVALFTSRGCSEARGCWCMYYRRSGTPPPPPPGTTRADANRAALEALVAAGEMPGLIGYRDGSPVGWVSLGPREAYTKLARSPVMRPVDDTPVWSIVCFTVPAPERGRGLAAELLRGAIAYARVQGATVLEAYPIDREVDPSAGSTWFGTRSMFAREGFVEVARRRPARPVMRLVLG